MNSAVSDRDGKLRAKAEAQATRLRDKRVEQEKKQQAAAQADTASKISKWQEIILTAAARQDQSLYGAASPPRTKSKTRAARE